MVYQLVFSNFFFLIRKFLCNLPCAWFKRWWCCQTNEPKHVLCSSKVATNAAIFRGAWWSVKALWNCAIVFVWFRLVAGAGFEPATFRLWVIRIANETLPNGSTNPTLKAQGPRRTVRDPGSSVHGSGLVRPIAGPFLIIYPTSCGNVYKACSHTF